MQSNIHTHPQTHPWTRTDPRQSYSLARARGELGYRVRTSGDGNCPSQPSMCRWGQDATGQDKQLALQLDVTSCPMAGQWRVARESVGRVHACMRLNKFSGHQLTSQVRSQPRLPSQRSIDLKMCSHPKCKLEHDFFRTSTGLRSGGLRGMHVLAMCFTLRSCYIKKKIAFTKTAMAASEDCPSPVHAVCPAAPTAPSETR
jgi:hypothetical protein